MLDVKPALTWKAKILTVKEIPEGALVGYGGTFRAPPAMRIAVLGAGYADGVSHRLSNRGKVIAAGKLVPILGTISMDSPPSTSATPRAQAGDEVTLLGPRRRAPGWTRSRSRAWRARFPTLSSAASETRRGTGLHLVPRQVLEIQIAAGKNDADERMFWGSF